MRLQLRGATVDPVTQRANDTHRIGVVLGVLGALVLFAYLFTPLAQNLGVTTPADLALRAGLLSFEDDDGSLRCRIRSATTDDGAMAALRSGVSGTWDGVSRLVLLAILAAAFLCSYYAPVSYKRPSTALWFLLGFWILCGWAATLLLLSVHMVVYLTFHPAGRRTGWISALAGASIALSVLVLTRTIPAGADLGPTPLRGLIAHPLAAAAAIAAAGLGAAGNRYGLAPLLTNRRFASMARLAVVQTPLVALLLGAVQEGLGGSRWRLPMGLLFAFWQWERLMVHYADDRAGDLPRDLPFLEYLSVFMAPQLLSNYYSAPYVGQAHAYLSSKFLGSDKNRIVLRGLGLLGIAALYFTIHEPMVRLIVNLSGRWLGVTLYTSTTRMVQRYLEGIPMGTATVLFSTILDQARIYLLFGALTHFRIGAWRLLGHDVDPQYNKPWMATNLVAFWGRFAFHYREFLVRTFYYPIFFRFFKKNLMLRVFVATMVSTSIGNHIWGHVPDHLLSGGMTWEVLVLILRAWPYYLLLGLGISLTQLYLMRKGRTRKPWTLDRRIGLDVLAAYATIQYFCLIHIFARPQSNGTLGDLVRLCLIGLGIHL